MRTQQSIERDATRFMKFVLPEPNSGCWLWSGGVSGAGYGLFKLSNSRVMVGAHRWSYEHHIGLIPDGQCACHHCDNPNCVNPKHIFAGTYSQNFLDAGRKKRHWNSRKTHCKYGHEFTGENTCLERKGNLTARRCKACKVEHHRSSYLTSKKKAAKEAAKA